MVRATLLLVVLPALAQGSWLWRSPTIPTAAPIATKKVDGHVQLTAEQQKTMHWGCVNACKPSPVESKCVTACEAASYKCIDETGPNEKPEDTEKCQADVLKLYEETKGVEKKEEKKGNATKAEGKKEEKKAEKKAKMFLQVDDDEDDDVADATEAMNEDQGEDTISDEEAE